MYMYAFIGMGIYLCVYVNVYVVLCFVKKTVCVMEDQKEDLPQAIFCSIYSSKKAFAAQLCVQKQSYQAYLTYHYNPEPGKRLTTASCKQLQFSFCSESYIRPRGYKQGRRRRRARARQCVHLRLSGAARGVILMTSPGKTSSGSWTCGLCSRM